MKRDNNRLKWALLVKRIVDDHYIPESERDCMKAIWLRHVRTVYPISLHTFYRWMQIAVKHDGYIGDGGNRVYTTKIEQSPRKSNGR